MTVYKPKSSRHYHFDFQFRGQRYHGSTGCQAKRDAEAYERDQRTQAALGTKVQPSITWDEACGLYWQHKGQFERDTSVKGQLARLVTGIGKARLVADLTQVDFSGYIAKRRAQTARGTERLVANATVNREITLSQRVVKHASGAYSVCNIEWRKLLLREPVERVRELSGDEEAALFAELDDDLSAVVEFAMLSGQRRKAVITLLWSNVDLKARRAKVFTKGDKWHEFPLTQRMLALIANRPKVNPRVFTYVCERPAPRRADRPARIKGDRYPFSEEGWTRKWKSALKRAGVVDFRFHDLRHTAGSRITRGSNLKVAQKLLGHTNIATTSRYAHVHDEDIRNAMEFAEQSRNSPDENRAAHISLVKKEA
jgi:integrase